MLGEDCRRGAGQQADLSGTLTQHLDEGGVTAVNTIEEYKSWKI
jgi:hypothetical protein